MGHHAENIPRLVTQAGDMIDGAVGIRFIGERSLLRHIAKNNLVALFQTRQARLINIIVSFRMCNREGENLTGSIERRERGLVILNPNEDRLADELQGAVSTERPRQKPRLYQDLKSVADPEDIAPPRGKIDDRPHQRR